MDTSNDYPWIKVLVLMILYLVLTALVIIPFAMFADDDWGAQMDDNIAVVTVLGLALTIYVSMRLVKMPWRKIWRPGEPKIVTWQMLGLALGTYFVFDMFLVSIGIEFLPGYEAMKEDYDETFGDMSLMSKLSGVLLHPVLEEIFFRGIIFSLLRTRYSLWFSIFFSSLLFGLIHLLPLQIISAGLGGALLAWLYERCGTLWVPILLHAINNLLAVGLGSASDDDFRDYLSDPVLVLIMAVSLIISIGLAWRLHHATQSGTEVRFAMSGAAEEE